MKSRETEHRRVQKGKLGYETTGTPRNEHWAAFLRKDPRHLSVSPTVTISGKTLPFVKIRRRAKRGELEPSLDPARPWRPPLWTATKTI